MAKKIVAGNWKMNLNADSALTLIKGISEVSLPSDVRVIVFPSSVFIGQVVEASSGIEVGCQNFSNEDKGAFTGEISINQIKSIGANVGLIGHSERRAYYKEDNALLKTKVDQAIKENFDFIFCCGEPLFIREEGKEFSFVREQLNESLFHLTSDQMKNRVIAYEPVWAIGTGKTASSIQAEDMHLSIRSWITEKYSAEIASSVSILYGGSCKPSNAKELFACPNVDGGLIGGAALDVDDFSQLIKSF
ncbi:MAG: triose-phosphate isomerase [Flavobacteriales bacterium]|nr:triose-phosphate isomerase [Flavobacteriales bacterium]